MIAGTWSPPVDLDNCASEPIHIPGAIQPHGVLIAVTEPELIVAVVSCNTDSWFAIAAADAIGMHLSSLIGTEASETIDRIRSLEWLQRFDEIPIVSDGQTLTATIYRSGLLLVIEMEATDPDQELAGAIVREAAMALQTSRSVIDVADAAARWIRSLTGFDRVMVYRFDPDWNGEVIAERKQDDLNTFLGLHYPASDIPAQARELYRRNWLRIIPDIGYQPVPLLPPVAFDTARPLDLSTSTLRSVSPIHVEYLRNMGVGASMSVSIVVNGDLWGLIACHHYSGVRHVSVHARNAAEFLAQLISLRIAETIEADERVRTIELSSIADGVAHAFAAVTQPDIHDVIRQHASDVLALAGATGFVLRADGTDCRIGAVPDDHIVDAVIACWPGGREILESDRLGEDCPEIGEHFGTASGVLAFVLNNNRTEFMAWFRAELVQAIDWGGDPHNAKLAAADGDDIRLSPRKSFDLWRETIRGRAERWDISTIQAAQRFHRHVGAALFRGQRDAASLAKDLQRVMRPVGLPTATGYEFAVFSKAAGRGEIGGDWYDAFRLPGGLVALVVGDVAGHGLAAASEMAQLRNVLRAYLARTIRPADALAHLDDYMTAHLPDSIATVVCAVIDTTNGTLHISHAGHPPALIVGVDGGIFLPLDGDSLLGHRPKGRRQQRFDLAVGETIFLYSDGLVETRQLGIDHGLAALRHEATEQFGPTVSSIHTPPQSPAERVTALAESLLSEEHHDDVTILTVQRTSDGQPA